MQLSDLFFWTTADNNTGMKNITGDELAALINAGGGGASPFIGMGANVRASSNQNIVNGLQGTVVVFNIENYDDLDFVDLGADNDRMTIPVTDPQITRISLSAFFRWNNTAGGQTGVREMIFTKNGGGGISSPGFSTNRFVPPDTGATDALNTFTSQPQQCVAGDFFGVTAFQNSGNDPQNLLGAQLSIAVLR